SGAAHGDGASSASDDPQTLPRNISAPLLGSFPFSLRDLVQIPLFGRTAGPARSPADATVWRDADGGGAATAGANAGAGPEGSLGTERGFRRPGVNPGAVTGIGVGVRAGARVGAVAGVRAVA
ncbi:unnamed protein product, partial [Laminaria digitata]